MGEVMSWEGRIVRLYTLHEAAFVEMWSAVYIVEAGGEACFSTGEHGRYS